MNQAEYARDVLEGLGYTEDFEDISEAYGAAGWTARNPSTGKWGKTGYSAGTCEMCDPTYDWTASDYIDAIRDNVSVDLDEKPRGYYW